MGDNRLDLRKYEGLEQFAATEKQRQCLAALHEYGSFAAAAEAVGMSSKALHNNLRRLRERAAKRGWAPEVGLTIGTAEGYFVKRRSVARDGDGNVKLEWLIEEPERRQRYEAMRIACEELAEPLRGKMRATRKPKRCDGGDDLLATYLIGDHHNGMYSWAEETGADYDVDIAERLLDCATERISAALPNTREALILNVGDFNHADNHSSRTPQSGHALDTDSRHSRVIRASIRMKKRMIVRALRKHETVRVQVMPGNHDPESSMWLAYCLDAAFENEPRVTIDTSPRVYRYMQWGRCLLGMTHGDRCKPDRLVGIMAADVPEMWGETKFRHWYTGHVHHRTLTEYTGGMVETLSVLPPGDAWHIGAGYRSQRGMQGDVWCKRRGRIMSVNGTMEYVNDD